MGLMRTWGVALVAVTLAAPVAAQEWDVRTEDCDSSRGWGSDRERWCEVRTTAFPSTGRVDLDGGPNGGVEVTAWDRDEVSVVAHVWGRADSEARAREIAREVRIDVDGDRIRADGPRWNRHEGWGVSYELRVPGRTDLDLSTTNGGVSVGGVYGDIDLDTTNGGVELWDVGGDVRGHTTNGGIEVRLSGDRWEGDGLDVSTTNGGVVLAVPEGYSARLETGTTNGSIDLDFPITLRGRIGRSIETVLGDGGPTVRVRTTNGGVELIRR